MDTTYRIVRHRASADYTTVRRRTIRRGLTLEEAQEHCRRPDTHGPHWFDSYTTDKPTKEQK